MVVAAVVAIVLIAICTSDFFFITSSLSSNFLKAAAPLSLAFWDIISNICFFYSCVILDTICKVPDKSSVREDKSCGFFGYYWLGYKKTWPIFLKVINNFVGRFIKTKSSLIAASAARRKRRKVGIKVVRLKN